MPSQPTASLADSPESPHQQQDTQPHQKHLSGESIMSFMTAPESQEPEVASVPADNTKAPGNGSSEKTTVNNKNKKHAQRKRKDSKVKEASTGSSDNKTAQENSSKHLKKQAGRSRKASKVTDPTTSDNREPTSGSSGDNTVSATRRNSNTTSGTSDKSKKGKAKQARGSKNKKESPRDKEKEKDNSQTMSKKNGGKKLKPKDKHYAHIAPEVDPSLDQTYPEDFKISVMCCESLWYTHTAEFDEHTKSKPLTEHCQVFSDDKKPECKSCDAKFATIWSFRRHMRLVHSRDLHRFQQEMQIFFACKKALNPPAEEPDVLKVLDHPVVCCGSKFENVCHLETHLDNVHNMPDWYHKKEKVDAMMQCKESFERYLDLVRKQPGIDPNAMRTYQIAQRHFLDATNGIISGWNQNASWQDRRDFQEGLGVWGEAEQATWGPAWSGVGAGGFTPQDFQEYGQGPGAEAPRGRQLPWPHHEPSSGTPAGPIVLEGAGGCVPPGPAHASPGRGRARSYDARYQPQFTQPMVLETSDNTQKGSQTPPAPHAPKTPPQVAPPPLASPPPLPSVHATPKRLRKNSPVQLLASPTNRGNPASPISPDHPTAFMNQIPERLQYKTGDGTDSPAAKDRYMVYGQDRGMKIPQPMQSVQSPIQPMQQIQSPVQSMQPLQLVSSMEQLLAEHNTSSHPYPMSFRNTNSTYQGRGGKKGSRKNKNGRRSPDSFQQGEPGSREGNRGFSNKQQRPFQPRQQYFENQTYLEPSSQQWQPHHFNSMSPGQYTGLSAPSPSQTVLSIHSGPPVFNDPPLLSGTSSQHSGGNSPPFHGEPQTPQFANHAQTDQSGIPYVPVANMMPYQPVPGMSFNAPPPDANPKMNAPWAGLSAQAKEFVPSLTAGSLIRNDRRHASNESLDTNPNEIRNDPQGWTE